MHAHTCTHTHSHCNLSPKGVISYRKYFVTVWQKGRQTCSSNQTQRNKAFPYGKMLRTCNHLWNTTSLTGSFYNRSYPICIFILYIIAILYFIFVLFYIPVPLQFFIIVNTWHPVHLFHQRDCKGMASSCTYRRWDCSSAKLWRGPANRLQLSSSSCPKACGAW